MIAEEFDAAGAITDETIKLLNTNCSEIMAAYKAAEEILFRGSIESSISLREPNYPRLPKDSDPNIQQAADEYLKQLGFVAMRSNSMFATSDFHMAFAYTRYTDKRPEKKTLYMVFPFNGFDYTWSSQISDFYVHTPSFGTFKIMYPTAADFQKKFKYQANNLVAGIRSGSEIMITGKYYRIILNKHNYSKICKSLDIPMDLAVSFYCNEKEIK